jgi:hypothetical protein
VNPTSFANVLQVEPSPPPPNFEDRLALLEAVALKRDDDRTRQVMVELPINYGEPLRATA